MRVFLTGGTGFVGRNVVAPLIEHGFEVHALCRNFTNDLPSDPQLHWHAGDFLDSASVSGILKKVQASHWLHNAWITEHGVYWNSKHNLQWVEASLRALREFHHHGGERVVMTGSCAEYQWGEQAVLKESEAIGTPATLYGQCKKSLYDIASKYSEQSNLSFSWARLFFLYGPFEDERRLVASAITHMLRDIAFESTTGTQVRDFLHVADAAHAIATLLHSPTQGAVNIGSGEHTTLAMVLEELGELCNASHCLRAGALPMRPNDPASIVADTQRLNEELAWQPRYSLRSGLQATVEWWREHNLERA